MIAALLAATLAGAEVVSEIVRPRQPDGLSGITRVNDDLYLVVDDSGGRMFSLQFAYGRMSGEIRKCVVTNEIRLAGVVDGEGLAYDPLRKSVWVADERGARISEHDPRTGKRLSEVKTPRIFTRARRDLGIESLTISPDGLTMWTATEEAVEGDGGKATEKSGTIVRLQRFSRKTGRDSWRSSGQFPYFVDTMGGRPFRHLARSGLSDLCALSSGELIVLEREFSVKVLLPTFRLRLYRVNVNGATDISAIERLEGRRFAPVGKTLLLDADTGFSMYEGVCVGPVRADGVQTLLLVSDGDGEASETLMSVSLSNSATEAP